MLATWIQKSIKTLMDFLDRPWKGFGAPTGTDGTVKLDRPGSTGRPILKGRVNPSLPQKPERRFAAGRPLGLKGLAWQG